MKIIFFLIIINLFFIENALVKEKTKYIYRYKKNQYIDLGAMGIQGKNIAPGDLSVQERKRIEFKENLYERRNFKNEIEEDFNFFLRGK